MQKYQLLSKMSWMYYKHCILSSCHVNSGNSALVTFHYTVVFHQWCQEQSSDDLLAREEAPPCRIMYTRFVASWWFQPIGKIFVKLEIIPNFRGENKRYLKPPPSLDISHQPVEIPIYKSWSKKKRPISPSVFTFLTSSWLFDAWVGFFGGTLNDASKKRIENSQSSRSSKQSNIGLSRPQYTPYPTWRIGTSSTQKYRKKKGDILKFPGGYWFKHL